MLEWYYSSLLVHSYRHFGWSRCLYLQGQAVQQEKRRKRSLINCLSLKHYPTSFVLEKQNMYCGVDCVWNVMAHAQKPDFVFRRNGRVHLNRRGRQFSRLLAAEACGISGSNAGYTMFRSSVKSIGYPLHSPVSPSFPLPWVTVCHHISTGL